MVKLGLGPLPPEALSQSLESVTLHRIPGKVRIGVPAAPRRWEVEGIKEQVGHSDPVRASGLSVVTGVLARGVIPGSVRTAPWCTPREGPPWWGCSCFRPGVQA